MSTDKKIGIFPERNEKNINGFGVRHVQCIIIFLCFTMAYCTRTTMSVAVIAMTDKSNNNENVQIFDWNKQIQDYLLSSFFWGYMVMQIPAGQLAYKFGGKPLISFAIIANGLISLALPAILNIGGWKAAFGCRIVQGLTQGLMVPSIHTLIGKWAPVTERNRMGSLIYSGGTMGIIVAMLSSGKLASSSLGWPLIFYCSGLLSLFTGLLMLICGAESPATHKHISQEERHYIQTSLEQDRNIKPQKIPWRSMVRSVPLMALLVAHIGGVWGFLLLFAEMPSFLNMALGLTVENSGLLSALPYISSWFVLLLSSWATDEMVTRKIFTITTIRKMCNTIGTWGPAITMMLLTLVPSGQATTAIILIILTVSLDNVCGLGFMMNHIDLSPNFAGMLVSFTNCIAVGFGNLGPIIVGHVLKNETDITQWRFVFFISAGVYFITNLIFLIFGSGQRQPWDSEDDEEKDTQQKKHLLLGSIENGKKINEKNLETI